MTLFEDSVFKPYRLMVCAVAVCLAISFCGEASASNGSWGGSRGGFSSGGSWGSSGGGLLNGRQPVRNLLSRIGARFSDARSGLGSNGSHGSFGSNGSTGSLGSHYGSTGYASTSYGSSGGYSPSYVSHNYGSSGSYSSQGGFATAPAQNSFVQSGVSYSYPMTGNYSSEASYPVGDYGFAPGYPVQSSMGGFPSEAYGTPIDSLDGSVIQDGGSINSMLDGGGIQLNGGVPTEAPGYYSNPAGDGGGAPDIGPVDNGDDSTSTIRSTTEYAVLNVELPKDAKVLINDRLTSTAGLKRSYVSRGLKEDRDYRYRVTAIFDDNGREVRKTELVTLRPGIDRTVRFDFEEKIVTKLDLKIPSDAKITLCGKQMPSTGEANRVFETTSLKKGESWDDYKVEIEYWVDGKLQREEKVLSLAGGKSYSVAMGMEKNSSSQRVALR